MKTANLEWPKSPQMTHDTPRASPSWQQKNNFWLFRPSIVRNYLFCLLEDLIIAYISNLPPKLRRNEKTWPQCWHNQIPSQWLAQLIRLHHFHKCTRRILLIGVKTPVLLTCIHHIYIYLFIHDIYVIFCNVCNAHLIIFYRKCAIQILNTIIIVIVIIIIIIIIIVIIIVSIIIIIIIIKEMTTLQPYLG